MPKQTFYNLPEEKKDRLLKAAYTEFSRVPFEEASINAIIHQSDISRGSFYQYFEDKDDLYFHCLCLLKRNIKERIEDCFVQEKGKMVESLRATFKFLYDHYFTGDYQDFYHHFFVNMTYRRSRNIFANEEQREKNHPFLVFEDLVEFIDQDELVFSSKEELLDFLQYVFQNIHWTISKVFLQNLSEESAYALIDQRLSWMANGIIKKNSKEAASQ